MPDKEHKKNHAEEPSSEEQKTEVELHEEHIEKSEGDETSKGETTHHEKSEPKANIFKRWWHWACTHKKISIPVAVVAFLLLLLVIPFTRYAIAGLFIKQSFPVIVMDIETGKPVSSATVKLGGNEATTDGEGRASITSKPGDQTLEVSKKYYESSSQEVLVPISKPSSDFEVKLKATGRQVPVTVLNTISKKPVANATITAEGTEAKTDDEGKAVLVVPAELKEVSVTVGGEGFNSMATTLTVTSDEIDANKFSLTPSGKIYFLSNASGKIDMVKSNLDGTDRQTVLAGTGKEDKFNTVLLASPDWKYIALLSKRDGGDYPKLFLIETGSDKVTVMDEGEAGFSVYGWIGDRFVYSVSRAKVNVWEAKQQALKSYHAPAKKITTLDETTAEGDQNNYAFDSYDNQVYILGEEIAYTKNWSGSCSNVYYCGSPKTNGKQATFNSVRADGTQKKTVKTYNDLYIDSRTAEFGEIYILYDDGSTGKVDEYHEGKMEGITQTGQEFYSEQYPYYSVSPTNNKTLWRDYRDGKNVFFVGDAKGENGNEIGRSEDYNIYGWFTDEYVLLTKKGSEMHIMPASGLEGGVDKALKITDYYKPDYQNRGFGYGYGG